MWTTANALNNSTPFYAKDFVTPEIDDEQKYEAVITHLKNEIARMIGDLRK